ncbi:CPBP family intramembrane glutamic endopeptidase [Paenibacillus sp. N3.4]|uniref:CPBP family intramembrane glutamic endopeptidase n=1 Tax=Paenibacillus sp. N3.4 TaxID=2603222 RepID=UPI0011C797CC|nr:CPBP family intramembrane glutamic endopeptidase [Paenibacillus sp. N3.4]TXK74128.1 CPBP family intramembrane metalloprotease [Paenibacillus sp. N3.4]
MMKKSIFQTNEAIIYAVAVLLMTWVLTIVLFISPSIGLQYFSVVMFIPALVALIFQKIGHQDFNGLNTKMTLKSLLFGILYPLVFVLLCALLAQLTGIGKINPDKILNIRDLIKIVITIAINIFTVLGEEYGWRGFLLPLLTKQYGKTKATIVVGIIWALYHVPVVYFLTQATGLSHPLFLCAIQACVVFMISFPFSYCYYLSGSLIPVLFFHSIWNVVNTTVLGDIYSNNQGLMEGNLLVINGEGVLGLLLSAIVIFWFIKKFKKIEPMVS